MKKLMLMLIAVSMAFTSCKEEDTGIGLPKVSFIDTETSISKGSSREVKLILESAPTEAIKIPVEFIGDVVKDVDYTVSEAAFNFKAGEKEALLKIGVPGTITQAKEIILQVSSIPEGYKAGRFMKMKITTTTETTTIFSFEMQKVPMLAAKIGVKMNLKNQKGAAFKVPNETYIAISAESNSTAIEGVHYKFVDDKRYATLLKNKSDGYVYIELLKYEAGKNEIVFTCGEKNGYADGAYPTAVVSIQKPIQEQILGEWVGLDYYNLQSVIDGYWDITAEQIAMIPVPLPTDILKFTEGGKLELNLAETGKLKNYFRPCNWSVADGSYEHMISSFPKQTIQIPILNLSAANYNFSETNVLVQGVKVSLYVTSSPEHKEILFMVLTYDSPFASFDFEAAGLNFFWEDLRFRFIRKN